MLALSSHLSPPAPHLHSATGAPSPSRVSRELLSSTSLATPEGPTSGGAPRRMTYVRGCQVAWAWAGEAEPPAQGCSLGRLGAGWGSVPVLAAGVQWVVRQRPRPSKVWSQVWPGVWARTCSGGHLGGRPGQGTSARRPEGG